MIVRVSTLEGRQTEVVIPFGGALVGHKIISVKLTTADFRAILCHDSPVGREHMGEYMLRIASKVVL